MPSLLRSKSSEDLLRSGGGARGVIGDGGGGGAVCVVMHGFLKVCIAANASPPSEVLRVHGLDAQLLGASPSRIIGRHLLPSFMSHLIASATLSIPTMILGEPALSFLGLGLRPPITSWGVLLNEAQNINVVALYPWLMAPAIPVIIVVLAFNFFGDGLRDAADPYR